MWWLLIDFYSGMMSHYEVAEKFDELCRWGTPMNPDAAYFDPSVPATAAEKAAAKGLLAIASGG